MKLYCQTHSFGNPEELYQPPIIFLHPMGLSGKVFKNVAPEIAKRTKRKTFLPDLRNHGRSPWTEEMNYDVLMKDLDELMQENSISKAILVGSSMGGRIVINYALKYSDKVEALVVEDMTPRNIISSGYNYVKILRDLVEARIDHFPPDIDLNRAKLELIDDLLNISFLAHMRNEEKVKKHMDPDYVAIIKEGNRFRLECNADVVAGMLDNDSLVQNLPDLDVTFDNDALFLYGSKGFFRLNEDPSVKKLFPKAVVKRIEEACHLTHVDSPEEYINIITDFILQRNLPQSKY